MLIVNRCNPTKAVNTKLKNTKHKTYNTWHTKKVKAR